MRSEYKELGLELVSLEEKISRKPKRHFKVGEKKEEGIRYPFKMFLEEALTQKRNAMMDIFPQILRWILIGNAYSSSGGATPFKVQIKFDIPVFEGHTEVDVVDKWLNLLEGYFFVHKFLNKENITFAPLKVVPHVK
jgi:hypothetical protein